MIYQERMRRVDDQIFTAFDFPDCGQVRAKRPVSTTPLQALNLMNSAFVVDQAKHLADRAKIDSGNNLKESVARVFELIFTRKPSQDELSASLEVAKIRGLEIVCRALMNSNEFAFLP
jgi:preprotein translocase subunit Sss1